MILGAPWSSFSRTWAKMGVWKVNGIPEIRKAGNPVFRIPKPGFPETRFSNAPENPGFREAGHSHVENTGFPETRKPGEPDDLHRAPFIALCGQHVALP